MLSTAAFTRGVRCDDRLNPSNTSRCATERLADAGVEPSVGSVGDSYDNALAETINDLFKAEVIHRRERWLGSSEQRPGLG